MMSYIKVMANLQRSWFVQLKAFLHEAAVSGSQGGRVKVAKMRLGRSGDVDTLGKLKLFLFVFVATTDTSGAPNTWTDTIRSLL